MGVFPFYAKAILIVRPLFSLAQEAQEKSLAKKKRRIRHRRVVRLPFYAVRFVSPSAEGDQRSARWIGGRFLKKATEKLSSRFALNRSTNQNLNTKRQYPHLGRYCLFPYSRLTGIFENIVSIKMPWPVVASLIITCSHYIPLSHLETVRGVI